MEGLISSVIKKRLKVLHYKKHTTPTHLKKQTTKNTKTNKKPHSKQTHQIQKH